MFDFLFVFTRRNKEKKIVYAHVKRVRLKFFFIRILCVTVNMALQYQYYKGIGAICGFCR